MTVLDADFKEEVGRVLKKFKKDLYELHDLATKDEKTGIYNNRFFINFFELEIERARREKQKLSLVMVDIDFFKKLNDSNGHLEGDKVLYELAQHLKEKIRKYDIIARFGGEEFLIILPGASIQTAEKISERMRKSLTKNKILKKYNVTISIGITEYKARDTISRMIKRTDKAMYKAKSNGRDRIEVL